MRDNTVPAAESVIDVFLSYTRADKDWVRGLAERLESETIDGTRTGRPIRVFFDEWDIDVGENVVVHVNAGLEKARFTAVVVSPDMLGADWPTYEWTAVVASDPVNRDKRLIPLFLRDGSEKGGNRIELPAPFRVLNWIDFRRKQDHKRSLQRLLRRIRSLPPARGRRLPPLAYVTPAAPVPSPERDTPAEADTIQEVVLSNLLPVESYPGAIWSAPTSARQRSDVTSEAPDVPAFELREQRLYTFTDLTRPEGPFAPFVDRAAAHSNAVSSWMGDDARWRWFIALLNRCLRLHLRGLPVRQDEKGRFVFLSDNGATRKWSWGPGRRREREVAARKSNPVTGQEFWVHHGSRLRFQTLGDKLFLLVDPCYVFTSDGMQPLYSRVVGPLSVKWTGRERNASILRHVTFWSRFLSRGRRRVQIETGATPITLSCVPALARTQRGIEFDHVGFQNLIDQVDDELGAVAASVMASDAQGTHVFDNDVPEADETT